MGERKTRSQVETWVSCPSCGKTSMAWVKQVGESEYDLATTARCPRCSKTAHVNSIGGLFHFMRTTCATIALLKLDILDIQGKDDHD